MTPVRSLPLQDAEGLRHTFQQKAAIMTIVRLRNAVFLVSLLGGMEILAQEAPAPAAAPAMPVPGAVSPEAQAFYRNLRPRPAVTADYRDPATMTRLRTGLDKMFLANARRIRTDYTLEAVQADGVTAYWVRVGEPAHRTKVLLYLHGGGYILGSATSFLGLPLTVGPAAGVPVLSVEYRLAPEHPFPAAVDDSLAVYRWLLDKGYRSRDIAVFGDSAGGGLAVALALAARDARLALPAAIAALSPLADLTPVGDTRQTLAALDPIVVGDPTPRYALYAGNRDPKDPLISPVYADLAGLPPLLLQVGTRESLLSDSVRLARKAREAGVDVTLDVWEGMWHVWQNDIAVPESHRAVDELAAYFRRHLGVAKR
jgi:acetyl esterase/lipase